MARRCDEKEETSKNKHIDVPSNENADCKCKSDVAEMHVFERTILICSFMMPQEVNFEKIKA